MKIFILRLLLVLAIPAVVIAQTVPNGVTYQGRLTDASNAPVPDGTGYEIEVRLWSAPTGGTLLWGTRYTGVPLKSGAFNLILGSGGIPIAGAAHTLLAAAFNSTTVHLGVTATKNGTGTAIPAPTEILPRQQIFSTPYAFRAEQANRAEVARFVQEPPAQTLPRFYKTGLDVYDTADGRVVVQPGAMRSEANDLDLVLINNFAKRLDTNWAQGSVAGGRAEPLAGNSIVYVLLIAQDSNPTIQDVLIANNTAGSGKPTGWSVKAVLDHFYTNESGGIIAGSNRYRIFDSSTTINIPVNVKWFKYILTGGGGGPVASVGGASTFAGATAEGGGGGGGDFGRGGVGGFGSGGDLAIRGHAGDNEGADGTGGNGAAGGGGGNLLSGGGVANPVSGENGGRGGHGGGNQGSGGGGGVVIGEIFDPQASYPLTIGSAAVSTATGGRIVLIFKRGSIL